MTDEQREKWIADRRERQRQELMRRAEAERRAAADAALDRLRAWRDGNG